MKNFFVDTRYPGRFIIMGQDKGAAVALYGATGRSPSSLKRVFVEQGDGVYMTAVDATVAIEGNPDLLEYPAVRLFDNGIVVANGNQVERIENLEMLESPRGLVEGLSLALGNIMYEPDEYRTPRITGTLVEKDGAFDAALHIVRSASPLDPERVTWSVPLVDGSGSCIATYTGADVRPTPSFAGDPITVPLAFGSARNAVQGLFEMLAPPEGAADYRIGFVAAYKKPGEPADVAILNRLEP